ncbi:MAG: transaldolase [Actinobacteria bacterium]|nr:transaldolase [Actinomycetota bacterium]
MTKLEDLHNLHGQSPWLDNLRRDWLTDGEMAAWISRGVRGVTSNPSIFQKAMTTGNAYDAQFGELVRTGVPVVDAFWKMAVSDIKEALGLFEPMHTASGGTDGFVSIELAPDLARDTEGSVTAARRLAGEINAPNLLIKVPATAAGIPVIRTLVGEGCNLNVTLIFGLARYREVMEAYLSGLEDRVAAGHSDLSTARGVASFFVSRVDTEIDRRLDELGAPDALALRGKAAVSQSKLAYRHFLETFAGPRWDALARLGAHVQRPLWASTSTKNPAYSPTLYVDTLIGPDTVNTIPESTLVQFEQSGTVASTLGAHLAEAEQVMADLETLGIDIAEVSAVLEEEGVVAFAKAFDELMGALHTKAGAILARS